MSRRYKVRRDGPLWIVSDRRNPLGDLQPIYYQTRRDARQMARCLNNGRLYRLTTTLRALRAGMAK